MNLRGQVKSGKSTIGSFSIRFDGAVMFTMYNGESLSAALTRLSRHDMTISMVVDPKSIEDR